MPAQKGSDAGKGTTAADFNPKSFHEKEELGYSRKYQLPAASWTSKPHTELGTVTHIMVSSDPGSDL